MSLQTSVKTPAFTPYDDNRPVISDPYDDLQGTVVRFATVCSVTTMTPWNGRWGGNLGLRPFVFRTLSEKPGKRPCDSGKYKTEILLLFLEGHSSRSEVGLKYKNLWSPFYELRLVTWVLGPVFRRKRVPKRMDTEAQRTETLFFCRLRNDLRVLFSQIVSKGFLQRFLSQYIRHTPQPYLRDGLHTSSVP